MLVLTVLAYVEVYYLQDRLIPTPCSQHISVASHDAYHVIGHLFNQTKVMRAQEYG